VSRDPWRRLPTPLIGRHLIAAARALGSLDLLVNNASTLGASVRCRTSASTPLRPFDASMEVNVIAPLALFQEAADLLRDAPEASCSRSPLMPQIEPYEGWGGYGSSKAALDQLHRILGDRGDRT
jgi:NAD(P)-dependent dehydrogenase (short-subunit alcohol dehydrogenase family)